MEIYLLKMALASISEKSGNMKLSHTPKIVKLESIKQVTPRVKIFSFYQEEIAKRAKPGQFLMIWTLINGKKYI